MSEFDFFRWCIVRLVRWFLSLLDFGCVNCVTDRGIVVEYFSSSIWFAVVLLMHLFRKDGDDPSLFASSVIVLRIVHMDLCITAWSREDGGECVVFQSELLIRVGHRCLKSICFQESLFGFAHIEYEFGVLGSKNLVLLWRSSFSQAEQVGVRFSGVPFNLFYFYVSSTFVKWGFAGSVSTLPVC